MEDHVETLDRARHRMLLGFLVSLVAWQVPGIAHEGWGELLPNGARAALGLLGGLGAVAWLVYGLRLVRLRKQIAGDAEAVVALEDERVRDARSRALGFAFWVVIVFLVGVRLAGFVVEIPAGVVAQAGLVLAPAAAIAAFLFFDRD